MGFFLSLRRLPCVSSKRCRENKAAYFLGAAIVAGCIVFAMMGAHIEKYLRDARQPDA